MSRVAAFFEDHPVVTNMLIAISIPIFTLALFLAAGFGYELASSLPVPQAQQGSK